MVKHSPFFVAVMLIAGCGKTSAPTAAVDPVAGMKAVMGQLETSLNKQQPVISPPEPADSPSAQWWSRQIYTTQSMEFDIKKTDSLVSPYQGIVIFQCNARFSKGASKQDVQGELREFTTNKCRATYAFQENRWVFQTLACNRNPMTPDVLPNIEPGDTSIQGQCRDIASAAST